MHHVREGLQLTDTTVDILICDTMDTSGPKRAFGEQFMFRCLLPLVVLEMSLIQGPGSDVVNPMILVVPNILLQVEKRMSTFIGRIIVVPSDTDAVAMQRSKSFSNGVEVIFVLSQRGSGSGARQVIAKE